MILTHSKPLVVGEIDMKGSPTALGKTFKGDYAKSSSYVMDVISELSRLGISSVPGQTLGIFYDDPSKKQPDQLMSFQGVFVAQPVKDVPPSFIQYSFRGRYVYVKNSGPDIMKIIFEAYSVLFGYIQANGVKLKSPSGYQVLTHTDNGFVAEILMELE